MAEAPDSLILVFLRRLDEKMDGLADDMREVKGRLTTLEETCASLSRRIDRVEGRLDRIERRLELAEAK